MKKHRFEIFASVAVIVSTSCMLRSSRVYKMSVSKVPRYYPHLSRHRPLSIEILWNVILWILHPLTYSIKYLAIIDS